MRKLATLAAAFAATIVFSGFAGAESDRVGTAVAIDDATVVSVSDVDNVLRVYLDSSYDTGVPMACEVIVGSSPEQFAGPCPEDSQGVHECQSEGEEEEEGEEEKKSDEAPAEGGGGCNAAGGAPGAGSVIMLGWLLTFVRRRNG